MPIDLIPYLFVLAALACVDPFIYFVLKPRGHETWRNLGYGVTAALMLTLPLAISPAQVEVRFFLTLICMIKGRRAYELRFARLTDPAMASTYFRYLVWSATLPDLTWATDATVAAHNRSDGRRRILDSALLIAGGLALLGLDRALGLGGHGTAFRIAWQIVLMTLAVQGLQGFVEGAVMATSGAFIAPTFRYPLVSRSLREFWGARWNVAFSALAKQHIARPLRSRGVGAATVAILVFAFSALCHQYLVLMTLSTTTGKMAAFFLVQGAGFLAERAWVARGLPTPPPALARVLLWAWMLATAPLFFSEMARLIPVLA